MKPVSVPPARALARLVPALLAGLLATALQAQQLPSDGSPVTPEFVASTQKWLDGAVAKAQEASATPLRMEVSLGSLDARLRLAPCTQVEPYIPVGLRLWGRTRLGLRCTDGGGRWNVFLPVTIKAFGPAWVLRDNVVPGQVLSAADAVEGEVDWAEEAAPVLGDPDQWVGTVATRALMAGQALRSTMVKAAQAFPAGARIRVVAQGPGFEATADAQALTAGVIGQPVRVRMENGRITTGVVQDPRTVRVAL